MIDLRLAGWQRFQVNPSERYDLMKMDRRALARATCLLAVAGMAGTSAACGNDSSSGAGGTTTSSVLADSEALVAELSTAAGTYVSPPTSGPEATPGKSVWVIGFGNLSPASVSLADTWANELSTGLDWSVKYVDGKTDPNAWLEGVRNAVNAKADGIVLQYIDCAAVKSGLLAAEAANIPVVSIDGSDCPEAPLFFGLTGSVEGSGTELNEARGIAQAAWVVASSEGDANVVSLGNKETPGGKAWADAFESELQKCGGCAIDATDWSFADFGPALQQLTQQALLKNPEADYVYAHVDDAITAGVASGVQASGRSVDVVGFDCQPSVLELMAQGKVAACFNYSPAWEAYAAADLLVRAFAGEEPTEETGRGMRLVTPEVNFPSDLSVYPEPDVDFRAIYKKTWGVN